MPIELWIPGTPIAQPRHRATAINGMARMYLPTSAPVNTFKAALQLAWGSRHPPFAGPVAVRIECYFPRPKSKTKKRGPNPRFYHVSRPDADNIEKAVMDGLNQIAWRDDCQICELQFRKFVAGESDEVGTKIVIEEASL